MINTYNLGFYYVIHIHGAHQIWSTEALSCLLDAREQTSLLLKHQACSHCFNGWIQNDERIYKIFILRMNETLLCWNDMRLSKWWQICRFCVNYPFKHFSDITKSGFIIVMASYLLVYHFMQHTVARQIFSKSSLPCTQTIAYSGNWTHDLCRCFTSWALMKQIKLFAQNIFCGVCHKWF